MCPPGCLHSICEKATRRGFLKAGFTLAVGSAAAASGGFTAEAVASEKKSLAFSEMTDMSHALYEGFPTFGGEKWFTVENIVNFKENKVNLNRWTLMEHTGTHMDAPIHFSEDGMTADLIPISDLVVPLAVIDISARAQDDPDTSLTPDDIKAWEAEYGQLPEGCCVVMNSGWHRLVGDPKFTGRDNEGLNHVPGFHEEAARFLLEERDVKGIGVDTLSLDTGLNSSGAFPVHYEWLGSGRWGVEAIANLDAIPQSGAHLFLGLPKVKGATGGPARVIALM
ncbi:cyclase family protein [Roseibium limicola]|uniref:Cyclase family protein n=1 Tax=Roseibium limicola TaxID=2816037 RepID=A0A939EPA6_9HYPH|nr:cyclase family protein [Roseibium limicola]MBO0346107.1 cyclase family protein [Roseibium limicola]